MKPLVTLAGVALLLVACSSCDPDEKPKEKTSTTDAAISFDVAPDGKSVVFSSTTGDLYRLMLDTNALEQLTTTPETVEGDVCFAPDGKAVIYIAERAGRAGFSIFEKNLADGKTTQLTNEPRVSDERPVVSRDGSTIAFARAKRHRPYSMGGMKWDLWDIYVMQRDGSNVKRLTSESYYHLDRVAFDPRDPETIIYSPIPMEGKSPLTLFTVQGQSGKPPAMLLTPKPSADAYSWASDCGASRVSSQFVFISDRDKKFHYTVYSLDFATGAEMNLGTVAISRYVARPTICDADGSIFFLKGDFGKRNIPVFEIWRIDANGLNGRRIADNELFRDPDEWAKKHPAVIQGN